MTGTGRPDPRDPARYDLIEEMVGKGYPDHAIVKALRAEPFNLPRQTAYDAIRRFERTTREMRNRDLQDRRARMILQLEKLQIEARVVADQARNGFTAIGPEGPVQVQDPKSAAMAHRNCDSLLARLIAVDGLSVETEVKTNMMRLKFLKEAGMTEEELNALIRAEVDKAIDAMPIEELEQKIRDRRGE